MSDVSRSSASDTLGAPLRPFTQEWGDRFRAEINDDIRYREVGKNWTWPLALVLERNDGLGYPEDVVLRLELDRGHCHGAHLVAPTEAAAPFSFRAAYAVWKRIVRGQLDPIAAVMRRELSFEGSLTTLVLQVATIHALVACAQAVPTAFPDEI